MSLPHSLALLLVAAASLLGVSGTAAPSPAPAFSGTVSPLPPDVRAEMVGTSWHASLSCSGRTLACPPLDSLRLLKVRYWTFEGSTAEGELVVHADVAEDVLGVFERLFAARFPIRRMERVDAFGGDDEKAMAADDTSAFNCRCTTGGARLSEHATGRAIDLNPVENPYVFGKTIEPEAGRAFADRSQRRPGMIRAGGPAVRAFRAIGWGWGGAWRRSKDYQHFSASGR